MVSGADLLTIYLGTELMSLSLYVMAGLKRTEARSLKRLPNTLCWAPFHPASCCTAFPYSSAQPAAPVYR